MQIILSQKSSLQEKLKDLRLKGKNFLVQIKTIEEEGKNNNFVETVIAELEEILHRKKMHYVLDCDIHAAKTITLNFQSLGG